MVIEIPEIPGMFPMDVTVNYRGADGFDSHANVHLEIHTPESDAWRDSLRTSPSGVLRSFGVMGLETKGETE